MGKKLDAVGKKQKQRRRLARKHLLRFPGAKVGTGQSETLLPRQVEDIFASLPEAIMVCEREGKILWLNAAALKLFGVAEQQCRGKAFQEFLAPYLCCHKQRQPFPLACWLEPPEKDEAPARPFETLLTLQVPPGQRTMVKVSCSPVRDGQKQIWGVVSVFHELSQQDQQAFHLQRVHEAILALIEAIIHLPEQFPEPIASAVPADSLLLSPSVIFIAQQLIQIICQILDCPRACLKAIGPDGYAYFVAGSGFSAEQEQSERAVSGRFTLTEYLEAPLVDHLAAGQEVVLQGNRIYLPPELGHLSCATILHIPLFRKEHLAGLLCIIKEGLESLYTSEEVELVQAVAALAVLVMQWLHTAQEQTEAHARGRALQEVHQLSQSFFVLASHELRTPLTGILGNLQLVRRRLAALERQVATQAKSLQEHVALAQQPVTSALQSAQLQQRIIMDVIDDARLAANQFQLHFQPCDLLALVHRVVGSRAQVDSGHVLLLKIPAFPQTVFVLADAERIARVLTTYLENALAFSPAGQPVTVGMRVEEGITRVWVHNEGAGIPFEEQEHLWERFYRAKGNTVQNELDLSLGLRLYLCRAFIERHGGQVGVQSTPEQGATFWFTLPRISQQREGREKGP